MPVTVAPTLVHYRYYFHSYDFDPHLHDTIKFITSYWYAAVSCLQPFPLLASLLYMNSLIYRQNDEVKLIKQNIECTLQQNYP